MRARSWMGMAAASVATVAASCGFNADDPYLDAPVVSLAEAPPPISGGTLMATRDARFAVAADPDRHRVLVVDLRSREVREIAVARGSEPGRVIEGSDGRAFVALRRGGAVLELDVSSAEVQARHEVCASPRGLAWEASGDRLHVACADGALVTLEGEPRAPVRTLALPPDLRDVVATEEGLLVSRFRSAELLRVDPAGDVSDTRRLPIATLTGRTEGGSSTVLTQSYEPGVAVRLASVPSGTTARAVVLHQRARIGPEAVFVGVPRPPTTYTYSNQPVENDGVVWRDPCDNAVLHAAATVVGGDGRALHTAPSITRGVVPVDVAVSASGRVAVAFAGEPEGRHALGPQVVSTSLAVAMQSAPSGCIEDSRRARLPGQAIAVAFAGEEEITQLREPARLVVGGDVIELGGASVRDTGHDVFHLDTGGSIACASCHPEGGSDGHVWQFASVGVVRTQPLEGSIGLTPYHRDGAVPTFSRLMDDLQDQMAGPRLSDPAMAAAERWLQRLPAPPSGPAADLDVLSRGRFVFERADVGCANCHAGELGTDGLGHPLGDGARAWQTPPLRGVALRPPYLHDGRAADLLAAIVGPRGHGETAHLSPRELEDLLAYVRSL